jgi:hypothetical protein
MTGRKRPPLLPYSYSIAKWASGCPIPLNIAAVLGLEGGGNHHSVFFGYLGIVSK